MDSEDKLAATAIGCGVFLYILYVLAFIALLGAGAYFLWQAAS